LTDKVLETMQMDVKTLKLIPSKGGCFEITVDGSLIYSKLETGEFPEEDVIVAELQRRV
jgi:selenoprotein W-related protein